MTAVRKRKSAAILPLHYGERTEFAVTYFSDDWSELLGILEDPLKNLVQLESLWGPPKVQDINGTLKDPEDLRPWNLITPITALLSSVHRTDAELEKFANLAYGVNFAASNGPSVDLLNEDTRSAIPMIAKIRSRLQTDYPQGAFFVQFAIDTHTMLVRYLRPSRPTGPHFTGGIHDSTLSLNDDEGIGMLHFDLKDGFCNAKSRAQVAVDIIENPGRMIELIHSSEMKVSRTRMVDAEQTRMPLVFLEPKVEAKEFIVDPDAHQLTVEGLGDDPCCVCVWVCVKVGDREECHLEEPTCKCYLKPGSRPHKLIDLDVQEDTYQEDEKILSFPV